jgi:hypothetical protein
VKERFLGDPEDLPAPIDITGQEKSQKEQPCLRGVHTWNAECAICDAKLYGKEIFSIPAAVPKCEMIVCRGCAFPPTKPAPASIATTPQQDDWDNWSPAVRKAMYRFQKRLAELRGQQSDPRVLHELTAMDLLRRAVKGCRDRKSRKGSAHPRWVAVKDTFALGSGYSHDLCRLFDLDPDEMVKR